MQNWPMALLGATVVRRIVESAFGGLASRLGGGEERPTERSAVHWRPAEKCWLSWFIVLDKRHEHLEQRRVVLAHRLLHYAGQMMR